VEDNFIMSQKEQVNRLILKLCPKPIVQNSTEKSNVHKHNLPISNRQEFNFNTHWLFYRGDVSDAEQIDFNDETWELVHLPHTARLEILQVSNNNYRGIVWYRRPFILGDSSFKNKRIFVRFEGVMQVTDVWLNGILLGEHQGGYTPFIFDITNYVKTDGSENVIAVKANNEDNPTVPPGKPQADLDFTYFGGIYRSVKMIVVDPLHITDSIFANKIAGGGIFITTPFVNASSAIIIVQTNVKNDYSVDVDATVTSSLVDRDNNIVARAESTQRITSNNNIDFVHTMHINNPNIWSPDTPYLYRVLSEVNNGSQVIDALQTRMGVRSISFSKQDGFQLNGQRFILNGTNRGHQEYPYVGYAVPESGQYRDALLLKEGGANFVRSAVYPPDPSFLDACDELGLLVLDSIPGWQFFSEDAQFQNNSFNDVRLMIRRDRNHPSVILWEVSLNESQVSDDYASTTHTITHEEYPGNQAFSYGGNTEDAGYIFDVQNANSSTRGPAALIYREY
ncbi:unnamed protein product, partial [Didymodactylos carnosus]